MTRTPTIFDLFGPLPEGTTVLEASAGTGKTSTIAGLAVRYLAEGVVRIDELMLVTFGRAATAELRERVRECLVAVTTSLDDVDAARRSEDELVRYLARGGDDEGIDVRRQRLATAVANFDAATIATTHGFCHQMLAGMGIAADVDHDVRFAEWTGDLVTDVATDLYVTDYGTPNPTETPMDFRDAATVAKEAVTDPAARLEPADADRATHPEAAVRYRFAARARDTVRERKRAMRVMDYDDLLVHLRDALSDPETGEDACARVRSRYRIVLVDEFQDTDPVQWEILERAFHGHRTLVLIGDPKQAIYAFRGADVDTYLLATEAAAAKATLGTNWRSDRPLVDALRHVLSDVALGDPRILVHEVSAGHTEPSLTGAPVEAPLRIRAVPRKALGVEEPEKPLAVGDVRPFIANDVAADIVDLLCSDARITEHGDEPPVERPVEPADIAVLVQRNEDGVTVRDALAAVDVPVVLLGTISVFQSAAAREWRTLLTALEQPHRPGLARAAALSDFVGWRAGELAAAGDEALDALGARLREWAAVFTDSGVAALLERITATYGLTARVLARQEGERDLTDLRHVGQALHAQATQAHGGVASLVEWLQHRIAESREDPDEERSRRLESDAKAVQVLTVHRAKGMQFPIVYAPFLWSRWIPTNPDPLKLHDDSGARVIDVGGQGSPAYDEHKTAHLAEDAGESLRLAYVALTRAKSQVVTHWVPTNNTRAAPWHRLLFGERRGGLVPDTVAVPTDYDARERLTAIAATSGGGVSVEPAYGGVSVVLPAETAPPPELSVRAFGRALDLAWARTSYTRLTAALHEEAHTRVTSEPEASGVVDEVAVSPESEQEAATPDETWPLSPMGDLPGGAAFGTLVHRVLEEVDFAATDLRGALVEACERAGAERFVGVRAAELADALLPSLQTSLGPLAAGRRLADIAVGDRLDELEFELPLAGGDTPTGDAAVGQMAGLLRRHLPDDDPLVEYADDLGAPVLASQRMRGFLTGSIDAVLRVPGDDGTPRYLVVDYKTNWLGADGPLTALHYRPEALVRAMRHAHYPLQALLYSVALHRFLRWRQPGYQPGVHLGGVLYLFLRGMCGAETPVVDGPGSGGTTCGVFSWMPPPALVGDVSDLLDGGAGR